MARIPYADENNSEVAELAAQIVKERGKMHNLYRMLLNSPPVARGWLNLLTAVRQQAKLSGKFRELAILRVAILNGADYEHQSHVPFGLKEGLTQKQIDALPNWEPSDAFNAAERAVLAYTDSMTKEIHVPDGKFEPLRPHFDARELVELTATIAAYNLVSRFLEAVQIDHETEPENV
jgi:alkylhydroperoxidase family enzyme